MTSTSPAPLWTTWGKGITRRCSPVALRAPSARRRRPASYTTSRDAPDDRAKLAKELKKLEEWDFTLARAKMLSGEGYFASLAEVEEAERQYRKFLALTKVTGIGLVPSKRIDQFWHWHIIDTRRYTRDTSAFFGEPLHHDPYLGLRGADDEQRWKDAQRISAELWRDAYGEELYPSDAGANERSKCAGHCMGSCKP